jgi:multidrug resistance protein, MATE family
MSHPLDYQSTPTPRRPMVEMMLLAGPTVAQMSSYTAMHLIDTWMLARISASAATAAGNGGMFAYAVISLGMGVPVIINAIVSQHYGRGDHHLCGRYLWQGLWWALFYPLLLLPAYPFLDQFFELFKHDPTLAQQEAMYVRIVMGASMIKIASTAIGQFLLAINRPNSVLVSAAVGVLANAIAALGLIFGNAGLPALGLAGAAWAQNIGVAVELLVLILAVVAPSIRGRFNVLDWPIRRNEMKTLIVVGIPTGVQIATEVLAWFLFGAMVIGQFGTNSMAAHTFMLRYLVVGFMPCYGMSTAVTALVGRYIGMGRPDLAMRRAHLGFAVTAIYTISCGIFFYVARYPLIGVFTADPQILELGAQFLVIAAFYAFFDGMFIVYCGALRGAGDTFVPAVVMSFLCWGLLVGGGMALAIYRPQWGPIGPWLNTLLYGMLLAFFMFFRFYRGRWKLIHLDQSAPIDRVDGLETVNH